MTAAPPTQRRPRFYTAAEVATLMRVSKMTVYRLVHSGDLPAVRIGRGLRINATVVDAYLRRADA